MIKKMIIRYV